MKGGYLVLVVLFFSISLILAANGNSNKPSNLNDFNLSSNTMIGGQMDEHGCLGPAGYSWNESEQLCVREWLNVSNSERYQNMSWFMNESPIRDRDQLEFQEQIKQQLKNKSMDCLNCNFTQYQNKTQYKLKDGNTFEIKVMPETASETALNRLRIKNCNETNNCTIQLKEVGVGNETKLTYEVKAQKSYKVLGLFKNVEEVSSDVDSETGEVLSTKRPWWSFLATSD
jgi:hypothetical protein